MSKGCWIDCYSRYMEVRELHKKRLKELGDLANDVSRDSIIRYIRANLKPRPGKKPYSEIRIRQILNMSEKEITDRQSFI